jgi:hypothetical protein
MDFLLCFSICSFHFEDLEESQRQQRHQKEKKKIDYKRKRKALRVPK